jgi:endonuclease/exonuclease/phosphatase family metal-dependent hydrolase
MYYRFKAPETISVSTFRFFSIILLLILIFPLQNVQAQFLEDFEEGSKGSYAEGTVELPSGEWLLSDALLGNQEGDRKNGSQSVRLRDGFAEMLFDINDGANEIQFYASNAGFSGDTGGIIRIYFSQDEGANWQQVGGDVELTDEFQLYSIPFVLAGNVRFRVEKVEGGRVSFDDFRVEPFQELSQDPTLQVRIEGTVRESGVSVNFPAINTGKEESFSIRFTNMGEPDLIIDEIVSADPGLFYIVPEPTSAIQGGESFEAEIIFSPQNPGTVASILTIRSNDPETPDFELNLSGEAIDENELITVNEARQVEFGTRVTVAGRVTVADEFDGPVFFQDETGGIAVFEPGLIETASRGDSIRVTGPVTEYNPIDGTAGTFLTQIAPVEGDDNILYEIINAERSEPEPETITIQEMNNGAFEGQLVRLQDVTIQGTGVFTGDRNYSISDASDSGVLRIDGNVDDLVDAFIPEEPIEIVGVVDQFDGTYQIKPRDSQDLAAEPFVPEGEDIDKDLTLDVVTWNVEWFGAESNGPADNDLQMNNVIRVIEEIDADIYAFQEISDQVAFYNLTESLDQFRGFTATFGQTQKTAFLFKTAVVDSLDSGLLFEGQDSFDWAGRLPLYFEVNATVDGITRRILLYNVHAKAFGDQPSYNRRLNAARSLKDYLDQNNSNDRVIFLGDFNDQLTLSTYDGADESPYSMYLEDDAYYATTEILEQNGFASYLAGEFRSMIDHIVINDNLTDYHIEGAQRVENPVYIENFVNTTSDHAPVWTRFQFTGEPVELPTEIVVEPNYPNPFNPSTIIPFSLPEPSSVTIEVYDVLGRKVATLADQQNFPAGENEVEFFAEGLSSGIYLYRIGFENGAVVTGKMMLVK